MPDYDHSSRLSHFNKDPIAQQSFRRPWTYRETCSLFSISLEFPFLFLDIPYYEFHRCGNEDLSWLCLAYKLFIVRVQCRESFFSFLSFPHQTGLSSVSYSSLFFYQCDVRHAEFRFPSSLLKEGSSWRIDLIGVPS